MTVQAVLVAAPIDIDPALEAKPIHVRSLCFGSQLIQERSNVLLHLIAEGGDDQVVEDEQIERVVPAAVIGATR